MHTEVGVVEFLFRLCLFSLLAYKLYDLIKAYLLPMIAEAVAQEKKEQTELLGREKLLVSTQKRLAGQVYNQKQMFTLLERNVQIWHAVLLEQKRQRELKNEEVVLTVAEKRVKQNHYIALSKCIERSVPEAVARATKELENRYHAAASNQFLTRIIDQLDTEGS
jgi:hypothetical protein